MVTVTAKLPVSQIVHGNGRLIQRALKHLQNQSNEPINTDNLEVTQDESSIDFTYRVEDVPQDD